MPRNNDIVDFLGQHMAIEEVERFLFEFGGKKVPRRSARIEKERNTRILLACLLRTVTSRTVLTEEAARAVADEFHMSPKAVQNRWYAWNRTGRARLEGGATTDDATADETFRY